MPFIASKLPNGLEITHNGRKIVLLGANIGENLKNVSDNGAPTDNNARYHGYGLTELNDADAAAFEDWVNQVTYVGGDKASGKLEHPFPALENGSILGPFKSEADARREVASTAGFVETGFEGLDPAAEGVEIDDQDGKAPAAATRAKK